MKKEEGELWKSGFMVSASPYNFYATLDNAYLSSGTKLPLLNIINHAYKIEMIIYGIYWLF